MIELNRAEHFGNNYQKLHKTVKDFMKKSFRKDPDLLYSYENFKSAWWKQRANDYKKANP